MRHRVQSADIAEINRVLDLIQQDAARNTVVAGGAPSSADALTKAGAAQAKYGSAGVLLNQLTELARKGLIDPSLIASTADVSRPPANVLQPPTITPKITRHGELELAANGSDLKLDSRGYASTTYRLIREVP